LGEHKITEETGESNVAQDNGMGLPASHSFIEIEIDGENN
jgi:hypothetical protein